MFSDKLTALTIAASTLLIGVPANAQQSQNGNQGFFGGLPFQQQQQKRGNSQREDIVKQNFEVMKKPVELPGVPQFTGSARFLYGQVKRRDKGDTGIAMRYSANATPDAVTQFYRDGLRSYGWNVEKTAAPYEVRATKGTETCRVTIYPRSSTGTCDFYIAAQLKH